MRGRKQKMGFVLRQSALELLHFQHGCMVCQGPQLSPTFTHVYPAAGLVRPEP